MKALVWSEKYRPKNLEQFIGSDELKDKIRNLIKEPSSVPNFIFVSKSPGTGKTSLAHVVQFELGIPNTDVLIMNSSDERKIEHIRGKVKDFVMTKSAISGKPRMIICDEFDGMLATSQDALRFLMEKYQSNCKFILTANNIEKIIEPIQSRSIVIDLREVPKEAIKNRLMDIIVRENVICGDEALIKLIDTFYPDMRSMINKIQELAPNITMEKIISLSNLEEEMYRLLKSRKPYEARAFFLKNGMDADITLKFLMESMINDESLKEEDMKAYKKKIKLMLNETAKMHHDMIWGADKDIPLLSWMVSYLDTFER